MPTVNKRFLLRLIAVTFLLIAALAVVHTIQAERVPDALRWQAEHAAEQGKIDKSIFYLRQYLAFRPDDHDAAIKLGEMILDRGGSSKDLGSVLFLYERVAREAPERVEVKRKLVDLCIRLGRISDALSHLQPLIDKYPDDAQLREQMGICQTAQNRFEDARRAFEKAIQVDPARIRSYELLAQLLARQLSDSAAAQACLDAMIVKNPASPEAFLVRARFWKSVNKQAECWKDVEKLLALAPDDPDGMLMSAEILQGRGDIARARQTLTRAVELHPNDARTYRNLSWLEVCVGNVPAAIACLEQGAKELPNATDLLTPLADLLIQQGEIERVQELLDLLKRKQAPASQVSYLSARLLMYQGKWADAIALLDPMRTEAVSMVSLTAQLNLMLSICHENIGNRAAQSEALQRVLAIDPSHLGARLALGNQRIASGQWDEAIKEYTIAANSPFAPLGVHVTLARLRIARARTIAADWGQIEMSLHRLGQRFSQSVEPIILMSEVYAARGSFDKAAKLLRDEAGKKMNDPRLWVALAGVVEQSEGRRAALAILDEAQGIIGDHVELRLARGPLWAKDPYLRKAGRLRDLERGLDDLSEGEQLRLLSGLADLYANIRDSESLVRIYRMLAARRPRDIAVRVALLQELGDAAKEERGRVEAEIRQLEGEDSLTLIVQALLHTIEKNEPSDVKFLQAVERARVLVQEHPSRGDVHFALARAAERSGDAKAARQHYERAVECDRASLRYLQTQFAFLLKHGPDADARNLLDRLSRDPRLASHRLHALIEGSLAGAPDGVWKKCIGWLEPNIATDPRGRIWLGEFLATARRDTEAIGILQRAAAASPTLPDGWIALLSLLARGQQNWEAELTKAKAALSPEAFWLVCASCAETFQLAKPEWQPLFEKPGDRRMFSQARLELLLSRGDRTGAMTLLDQLAADTASRPEDSAWAKRNRVLLTIQSGNASEGSAALRAFLSEPMISPTLEDRRGRAALLVTAYRKFPDVERRTLLPELMQTLRAIATNEGATAKDWFFLAQMQHETGDRSGYRQSLRELLRREPDNLYYDCAYVDDLLADNDLKSAIVEIPKLEKAVQDQRAVATVARYYCLANEPGRVLEAIEHFEQAGDAGMTDGTGRTRHAAGLLDQLARLAGERSLPCAKVIADAAIARYRILVRQFPGETERFAALLAHLGQPAAALEMIEQQSRQLAPRAVAAAGLAVLRAGSANPQQFQLVKQWLDAAAADPAGARLAQLQFAEYYTLRHDLGAAEAAYRAVLKAEPNQVVALNNLAWLLATRPETASEALGYVERAIGLIGPTGELLDTRARILIAAGKYDRAVDNLNDALNQAPTSLRYFHLAMARLKQSKRDDAVKAFQQAKARGLDPKSIHPSDLPAYNAFASEPGS